MHTPKLYNPKSHSPSVYIPCWLIQVPHEELSFGAKLLYGRLSQWSSTTGDVFRSCPQLSKELGMGIRTIQKFTKELKDCKLINTLHPQPGGVNHFQFYDHPWMYAELAKELTYEESKPPHNHAVPTAQPCGTPPHNRAVINKKEIKRNKNITSEKKSGEKSIFLTGKDLLKDNPHNIESKMVTEWVETRKKRRAPITQTAWDRTNKVMTRLVQAGLNANDCFECMVASGWKGMEFKYFEQDLKSLITKPSSAKEDQTQRILQERRELKRPQKINSSLMTGLKNILS